MFHLVNRLSDVGVLLLAVFVLTALGLAAPYVVPRLLRLRADNERGEAAFDGFKVIVGMVSVVLAFSLVQSNGNVQSIETLVGKEAAAFSAVDRALLRIGQPELTALRSELATFGDAVVREEWPLLSVGDRSASADASYMNLSRNARAFAPTNMREQTLFAELVKSLDDLSELREQVIESSELSLPRFFWIMIAGLLSLAWIVAGFTTPGTKHGLGIVASAAAVGFLLAFVITVDRPFEGQTSIRPTAIEKALDRNNKRASMLRPAAG